jgi:hypothetical protein
LPQFGQERRALLALDRVHGEPSCLGELGSTPAATLANGSTPAATLAKLLEPRTERRAGDPLVVEPFKQRGY